MCPYCGGDCFVGATIQCVHCGVACNDPKARPGGVSHERFCIDGYDRNTAKWLNECKACGGWCVHREVDGVVLQLADPLDPTSEVLG